MSSKTSSVDLAAHRCGTCKDRKVACDRTVPACINCVKSKRQCGGYGMRLSWPRISKNKRAIVGTPTPSSVCWTNKQRDVFWVHTSSWDVDLHHILSSTGINAYEGRVQTLAQLTMPCLPLEKPWVTSTIDVSERDLLKYFETKVMGVLPMLDSDRSTILRLLMQMALADGSNPSRAVLHSILALAALRRDGNKSHTARYKLAALHALLASPEPQEDPSCDCCILHIAAGILLCNFEMQQSTEERGQWVGHICCTQGVIRTLKKNSYKHGSEASIILGWALYYDVLARFSLRHWRTPAVKHIAMELGFDPKGSRLCAAQYLLARTSFALEMPNIAMHASPVLGLLSEVCHTPSSAEDPRYHQDEYRRYLNGLSARLENLPDSHADTRSGSPALHDEISEPLELFRLATMIYLERASQNFSGRSTKIDQWIAQGFMILDKLEICSYSFPVFVLACEARTDSRRVKILELLAQTLKNPFLSQVETVQAMIRSAWVQDDLEIDGDVDYIRKMNLVLSLCKTIPAFI